MTNWKKEWTGILNRHSTNPSITINVENKYQSWVNSFSEIHKIESLNYLEEVSNRINILKDSTYHADAKIRNYFILLVDCELSKVEILEKQAVFEKTIWIVDYKNLRDPNQDRISYGSRVVMDRYKSKLAYRSYYINNFNSIQERLDKLQHRRNYISDFEYIRLTNIYNEDQLKISKHLKNIDESIIDLNYLFNEDWSNCISFPSSDNSVKRFKYITAPLLLDMGGYFYFRKYILNDFDHPGVAIPYLKKVSYEEFLLWLLK